MSEDRRKHLEFIQAVIARQAGNSFLVKGWALTVAAAFYGFAANKDAWPVAVIGIFASVAFGYLDAFFLRQERLFRCLYKAVIASGSTVSDYSMDTDPYKRNSGSRWRDVLTSGPLAVLFGTIVAAGVIVALATGLTHSSSKDCRTTAASVSSSSGSDGGTSGQMSPSASPSQRGNKCT